MHAVPEPGGGGFGEARDEDGWQHRLGLVWPPKVQLEAPARRLAAGGFGRRNGVSIGVTLLSEWCSRSVVAGSTGWVWSGPRRTSWKHLRATGMTYIFLARGMCQRSSVAVTGVVLWLGGRPRCSMSRPRPGPRRHGFTCVPVWCVAAASGTEQAAVRSCVCGGVLALRPTPNTAAETDVAVSLVARRPASGNQRSGLRSVGRSGARARRLARPLELACLALLGQRRLARVVVQLGRRRPRLRVVCRWRLCVWWAGRGAGGSRRAGVCGVAGEGRADGGRCESNKFAALALLGCGVGFGVRVACTAERAAEPTPRTSRRAYSGIPSSRSNATPRLPRLGANGSWCFGAPLKTLLLSVSRALAAPSRSWLDIVFFCK